MRVLVVEDDHGLRDVIARGLREQEFDVVTASDGAGALAAAAADVPDLVVLDIGLRDSDGRDVCQAMRGRGVAAPVLFLTARDNISDRLSGFAAGGDDYLVKPFHLAELVARLQALGRRGVDPVLSAGDLRLDPLTHCLTGPEADAALTPTEFRLLAALLASPGTLLRRRELVRIGWTEGAQVTDNTLDQYLTKLRRKLRSVGSPRTVETVRGVGHRLA